jgi:glutaminyl-tRNA synthetase
MLSKRKLIQLVEGNYGMRGWDDPRLPTINGLRRRGFTSQAIKNFCEDIGVTRKPDVVIPYSKLEEFVREHLNVIAFRHFAVFEPIKLTITNWNKGKVEISCPNIPEKDEGSHNVTFSNTIYIEKK